MADTTLPAVTAEVTPPALLMADGQPTATSLQVAEHFGKRHGDVIRAIKNLGCSAAFAERTFALRMQMVEGGKNSRRKEPMYHITRDGFALLAMGFTGKEAMRWKEAYIAAFNAMEAKLRSFYVAPLVDDKQFRNGIPLHMKLKLQEQGQDLLCKLRQAATPGDRRGLYAQLLQVNESLGLPTENAESLLGPDAPMLPLVKGGM